MKCFYHKADLDGRCSAAIVRRRYPDCQLIGIDYGEDFPWAAVKRGEKVFMVDFCLEPFADMIKLGNLVDLVWIDHHDSAITAHAQTNLRISGDRQNGIAACVLTWQYLYPQSLVPWGVEKLGLYDVWEHANPAVKSFQCGMWLEDTGPESTIWATIFANDMAWVAEVLSRGNTVQLHQSQRNSAYSSVCAFETTLHGQPALAINSGLANSLLFDTQWDDNRHQIMMAFVWAKKQWKVSLYSKKDGPAVNQIAALYGDGGHKHAAGFHCDDLPFDLAGQGDH